MKALHRRPLVPRLRHSLLTLAVPPLVLVFTAVGTAVVAASRQPPDPAAAPVRASHPPQAPNAVLTRTGFGPFDGGRRWPAEIEQLISSMPRADEGDGTPPMIETDQRCSRVENGLAHCVMLECQTAGEQTACFEMVVTARRLSQPPGHVDGDDDDDGDDAPDDGGPGAYEDHPLDRPPNLLDTRHAAPSLAGNDHRHPRGTSAATRF